MADKQPEAPPTSGLVSGKYQLVGMIGRGGMGSVWEARHASLGTRFAIKFIESEYADSAEARSRFDKEARAAAKIQSKHAIQIYDHGVTDDGKPYIVMELLEGEPLDKRIDRYIAEGRTMSLAECATILQQVCRGLARAHEHGIVHRDLKPENIFVVRSHEDDTEIAKVLDFGIAKMNGPGQPGLSSSTKTGAVLGTPFYMSPEQARGLRNVDHRTDVWSLAVIAYKCVTGVLPFDGESVGDLLVKICTAPVPVPSHLQPMLPPSFDAWFMRALEREPERRFATVTELAEGLATAAGIRPGGIPISGQGKPPLSALSTMAGSTPGSYAPNTPYPNSPAYGNAPYPMQPGGPLSNGDRFSRGGSQPGDGPHSAQGMPHSMQAMQQPHPAAMTAAPFTSSQPVAGVPQGRGKLLAGVAIVTLLIGGGATGAVMMMKKANETGATTNGVGMTPPPPATSLAVVTTDKPVDPAPTTTVTAPSATTSAAPTPAPPPVVAAGGGHRPHGGRPVVGASSGTTASAGGTSGTKPGDKPPLPHVTPVATQPTPPTTKPPQKNGSDPGY